MFLPTPLARIIVQPDIIASVIGSCSGLPSDRTNLSPFTKDFRGGGQVNEPIGNFLTALLLAGCY